MAEKQFKVGDNVKQKSGGPKMAVDGYDMAGSVICKWFVESKQEWKTSSFSEETLEPAGDVYGWP